MAYDKNDHSFKEWESKIDEEEARWRHIGIALDGLHMKGSEIFALQCKVQAMLNCLLEDDYSEENMNLNLKMIIFSSMEEIRNQLEPEITRMKLLQGVHQPPQQLPPQVIMPWLKKEGNGG